MEITKEELQELYNKYSVAEMSKRLNGASHVMIYKLLRQAGIPLSKRKPKVHVEVRLVESK